MATLTERTEINQALEDADLIHVVKDNGDGTFSSFKSLLSRLKTYIGATGSANYINVKTDYGATGNGSTDDTTAIQNAINAANAAGGGVVFLPTGTYVVGNLYFQDNVTIAGEGMGVSTLKLQAGLADASYIIRASADAGTVANNIHLRDLTLDGNKDAYGSADVNTYYGFYLGAGVDDTLSVFDVTITRVEAKNCKTYAFDTVRCDRVSYIDCWSHDNGYSTGTNNNCAGWETLSDNVQFTNCIAEDNAAAGFAFGQSTFTYENAVFTNCIARNNAQEGFYIRHNHDKVTLEACVAHGNDTGFYIRNGSNTTLSGCHAYSNVTYGCRVYQQNGLSVMGGSMKNNTTGQAGAVGEIELQSTTANISIVGGQYIPTATFADYAVVVDVEVGAVTIVGCHLGAGDGGVTQLSNGTSTILRGNIGAADAN